jgi:hypothetical protein
MMNEALTEVRRREEYEKCYKTCKEGWWLIIVPTILLPLIGTLAFALYGNWLALAMGSAFGIYGLAGGAIYFEYMSRRMQAIRLGIEDVSSR